MHKKVGFMNRHFTICILWVIGFVIGLLILKTAFDVARENLDNIMGKVPSPELVDRIVEVSNSVEKVKFTHFQ